MQYDKQVVAETSPELMDSLNADVSDVGTLLEKLSKEDKESVMKLSNREARFLCDTYLQHQKARVRANNQSKAVAKLGEPNQALNWIHKQHAGLESQLNKLLKIYAESHSASKWALGLNGVGPVIAAGLAAHIEIEWTDKNKVTHIKETAGQVWSFAGLNPEAKWEKGQLRPWNARLKTLMFYFSDCQVKFQNHKDNFYGKLYAQRRAYDDARNENMELADQAAETLRLKKIDKSTDAYKWYIQGKLPPARMLLRSQRWLAKIFLSHYFSLAYRYHFNEKYGIDRKPAIPWVIAFGGHAHTIGIPNDPFRGDW